LSVKKMERKTGLMFATLMLLVFSAATKFGFGSPYQGLMGAGTAGVAAGQSPCELFDGLVRVVNNTRQQVEAIVDNLPEDSDDLESIREELRSASEDFDEAVQLGEAGYCEEASKMLSEILREYGEIASEALEHDHDDDAYDDAVEAIELGEKIERAYHILSKMRSTVRRLEEKGLDVSPVASLLNETDDRLEEAKNATDGGDFERAMGLLSEVEELLDDAHEMVEEINRPETSERVASFLNGTRGRIGRLEDRIMGILIKANASQGLLDQVKAAFQGVYAELGSIEDSYHGDDLDDVLEDLDDLFDDLEDAYEILDDEMEDAGEALEELEEVDAWIDHLEGRVERLRDAGVDVGVLSKMLEEARNMSEAAQRSWELGDIEEFEDYIDGLEEMLDDIEDDISDLRDEHDDDDDEFDDDDDDIDDEDGVEEDDDSDDVDDDDEDDEDDTDDDDGVDDDELDDDDDDEVDDEDEGDDDEEEDDDEEDDDEEDDDDRPS
jgi:hypothetical protein